MAKCLVCGANCRCKRAAPGLCCGCHSHKVRSFKLTVRTPGECEEAGVKPADYLASFDAHLAQIRKVQDAMQALLFPEGVKTAND